MAHDVERRSVSLVTQGQSRFYTLTIPSEDLAKTTFVTTRFDDPEIGFQRTLDRARAQQIADYIDTGGTIPNSVVLSAQQEANFRVVGKGKTVEYVKHPKAFLILDGQHRVYGFRLAKTNLRVPAVIYSGLTRRDEARLFIDINTKQRPVPNELLLDIKKLADYENDQERVLGYLFDSFNQDTSSPLFGLLSPSERSVGKISRVTFNTGMRPIASILQTRDELDVYSALKNYLQAVMNGLDRKRLKSAIVKPVLFRAFLAIFPDVGQIIQDKYNTAYTVKNFILALEPLFEQTPVKRFKEPGNSVADLKRALSSNLRRSFSL